MSQLNPTAKRPRKASYNGNLQEIKPDAQQLFEIISGSLFGKDQFYESTSAITQRLQQVLINLVKQGDLDFISNTIIFARDEMRIRSFPIVATVLFNKALRLANVGYPKMRRLVADVVRRADQLNDVYAYALSVFGDKKSVPLAIKKGIGDAFNKFDMYQFGKYNRNGTVKFKDLMRIVHPKPANETQNNIFRAILSDSLETPYTWETQISEAGQIAKEGDKNVNDVKRERWKNLIDSDKLGYMALMRNLRNLEQLFTSDSATMKTVAKRLMDRGRVLGSKQLPFRFISAMEHVTSNRLKIALDKALDISLENMPKLGDNVLIIVDTSGSMGSFTIPGSPLRTASLFGAAVAKSNASNGSDTCLIACATTARDLDLLFSPTDSVRTTARTISGVDVGYGTNLHKGLELAARKMKNPDTIIVLSDMQVNRFSGWNNFSQGYLKDAVKIAFNLNSYDNTPMSNLDGWYQLGGFSERVFDFVNLERDSQSIVKRLSKEY